LTTLLPPPDSAPTETSFDGSNECLSELNPVLYDALLAFAVFCVAEVFSLAETRDTRVLPWIEASPRVILLLAMLFFVVKDIGEVLKIDQKFPYRRVTRYGLEVLTVMLYGVSFGLARVGSYFAVVTFGLALFSGAAWCNALYVEGNTDPRNITTYAETLRALHYLGGLLCLLQFLTFGVFGPARLLSPMRSLAFAAILSAWIVFYEVQLRFRCGVLVGEYSVDFIVTPRRIRRWKRWRSARTRKAQVNRDLAEKARRERFIRPDNGVDEQEGDG
jgi:hypothetical protein